MRLKQRQRWQQYVGSDCGIAGKNSFGLVCSSWNLSLCVCRYFVGNKIYMGILCFGVGHVWMIAGIGLQGISAGASVLIFVLLYGIAFFVFRPYFGRLKQLKMPGLIYAALLCMMSAAASGAAITAGTMWSWARAVGSLCFVISDGIIGWTFIRRSRTRCSGAILMILYYLAVYLLGAAGL